MECALLFLAACLMFSGVAHGESQSMSCSTVNGKTICNTQRSQGNTAIAASQAQTEGGGGGGGGSFQSTYAGAGNPNQWGYSSQVVSGSEQKRPIYDYYYDSQQFPGTYGQAYIDGYSKDFPDPGRETGRFGVPSGELDPGNPYIGLPNSFSGFQGGAGAFVSGRPYSDPGYAPPFFRFRNVFVDSQAGAGTLAGGSQGEPGNTSPFTRSPNSFSGSQAGASGLVSGRPPSTLGYEAPLPVSPNSFADSQAGAFAGGRPSDKQGYAPYFPGSPDSFADSQAGASAFAGGRPSGYAPHFPGSPNSFADFQATAGGFTAGRPPAEPGYASPFIPNYFFGSQAGASASDGGRPSRSVGYEAQLPVSPNSFVYAQAGASAFAGGRPSGKSGYTAPFPSSPNSFDDSHETAGTFDSGRSSFELDYAPPSPNYFSGSEAGASEFARGGSFGASGFAFSPNLFTGAQAGGGAFAGGGIAVAGNIPFFSPADDYPIEDYNPSGGVPAQGRSFGGPMPVPSNPFEFVNRFMGGGPVVGGFAAAGAFPFGRR